MCFRFDACFGFGGGGGEDFGRAPSTPKGAPPHVAGGADHGVHQRQGNHGQGYHYGNGHKPASTHPATAAADEAGRKAYNDVPRKADHTDGGGRAAAAREAYGHAAAYYAQEQDKTGGYAYAYPAADETTVRNPAMRNQVGDGAGYKARFYEPADHKEDAATDYYHYHYPATTTVRYK